MFDTGHFLTVEVQAKTGRDPAEVQRALTALCEASVQEPGCLIFTAHQSAQDPSLFVLWEGFSSEDALKAHAVQPHSQQFAALGLVEPVRVFKSIKAAA